MVTRHFPRLFHRQVLRVLRRRPGLALINVAGIALGIAVFLAIQIANRSARESFRAAVELVAGRANLEVRGSIDERIFPEIARLEGVVAATPLVEGAVSIAGHPGEYLRLIGIDPLSGEGLRTFELRDADGKGIDLAMWLREPDRIAISREYADTVLPRVGRPLRVWVGGKWHALRPDFVLDTSFATGDPRQAVMDIGWAQELFAARGKLTSILVQTKPEATDTVRAAIRARVPADVEVEPSARRASQIESLLGAFQLNLTALSLVSVLVGAFLIYNTISASVVRRRTEIGILRATGASRSEVRWLFLGEASIVGLLGSLLGMGAALPLASALSAPLAQTISSLYILHSIDRLHLSPWQFFEALGVGLGASLLAAWQPAAEAVRVDPAKVLHPGSGAAAPTSSSRRGLLVGTAGLVAAIGCGWAALHWRWPMLGFFSAFGVLAGFSTWAPATVLSGAVAARRFSPAWRLAAANLVQALRRNAITVAALACAIAMMVGISVMIHSFRSSVNDWIGSVLAADVFIGPASPGAGAELPAGTIAWLKARAGVRNVETFASRSITFRGELVTLGVVDEADESGRRFLGTDRAAQARDFEQNESVIISEPFANRFGVARGESIRLPGERTFRVAGVYQDYSRSGGTILIKRSDYARYWTPLGAQSVSVTLDDPAAAKQLGDDFRRRFGDGENFSISSNHELRERVFEIFDQTFAVTFVLRTISILVAAAGVTLAMLILAAERRREIGVLRAIGASRLQVMGLFLRESALIGAAASALGLLSGAGLAVVLTWVVNKAFFGWTIQLTYPLDLFVTTPLWIIPVAVLAAIFPAWQAARVPPAKAVRFE